MSLNHLFCLSCSLRCLHWKHYLFAYLRSPGPWIYSANEHGPCCQVPIVLQKEVSSRPVSMIQKCVLAVGRTGYSGTIKMTPFTGGLSWSRLFIKDVHQRFHVSSSAPHGNPERQLITGEEIEPLSTEDISNQKIK